MLTVRQKIIAEIQSRLQRITKANGYNTDAGLVVHYGQVQDPNPDEFPMLCVVDGEETRDEQLSNFQNECRRLSVFVAAMDRVTDSPIVAMANLFKADIEKALYLDSSNQPDEIFFDNELNLPLVAKLDFERMEPYLLESGLAGVDFEFAVYYLQARGNPYLIN